MAVQTDYDFGLTVKDNGTTVLTASASGSGYDRSTEYDQSVIVVKAGAADFALPLGGVDPAVDILLESDVALSVKINGAADGIPFRVLALVGTSVAALSVTNAGQVDAKLRVMLKG